MNPHKMEAHMIFEAKYTPVLEDYSRNGKLSPTAILKILENAGSRHSESAGDSILQGCRDGHGWVLTDWRLEILEYPAYRENIRTETWPEAGKIIFGTTRNFLMYDDTGKNVVKASTKWVRLDLNTGRPVKIEPELMEKYHPDEKKVFEDGKMPKITEPESWTAEKTMQLRRSDIDFNNHLHNLCYLDFALDILPEPVYAECSFTNIRISYKSAVKEGETIVAKYALVEGKHVVGIFGGDGSLKTLVELE